MQVTEKYPFNLSSSFSLVDQVQAYNKVFEPEVKCLFNGKEVVEVNDPEKQLDYDFIMGILGSNGRGSATSNQDANLRRYKCELAGCEKMFAQLNHMKLHMLVGHKDK